VVRSGSLCSLAEPGDSARRVTLRGWRSGASG
jgi:hypothetical protein